ncbi:MAG TPA: DNA repair protein RecN [Candidatus Sulfopaludibacter sp.]|jgi:DNA repair protein RecN (Recombination protein N)|nr:DNA repair protein RecN [Candidatus Sulfopaludibacter sp.]
MLLELVVENYAVVERLRVNFHSGLNLLTGETGSGKSIVVDALGLLLGGRASADMIRTGEPRARVAGIFDVREQAGIRKLLEPSGLEAEEGELLVEREILASGKSRAFVGSRPVSVALLKDLAPFLADIHGQHDQQLLFSPDSQREMLDTFGGHRDLVERIDSVFTRWRAAGSELEELERTEQEKLRLLDLWSFQRKEIESADLGADEEAALENERRVLNNVQRLEEAATAAYTAVYDGPDSARTLVKLAAKRIEELSRIDASLEPLREHLKSADLSLQEVSYTLRDYLGRLEANPGRLEEVELRLAAIDKLKRKYGQSVPDILSFLADVRRQIESVETAGERMEELRKRQTGLAAEYETLTVELTARRNAGARKLEKRVEEELAQLAMERTVFRVQIAAASWSADGADRVDFLVSANIGEEPRGLEKVASGGEISRIALALKTCLAGGKRTTTDGPLRTLVFDEVDAGVGGSAAEGVGRRLKRLAATNQLLCVTHLPQIASFADHHYKVEKVESGGRTVTLMEELDSVGRTREVGRMLSGQKLTPEALKNAEQLIKMSNS